MPLRTIVDGRSADELAALLKVLRVQVGITQEELAERSGLSIRTISDFERGRTTTPHRRTIALLAKALDVEGDSLDELRRAARNRSSGRCPVCTAPWQWDEEAQDGMAGGRTA
jgi:transcriptional regulator with XRE-family HTH domain